MKLLLLWTLMLSITSATYLQKRMFSALHVHGVNEIQDVTDTYSYIGGNYILINKFTIHEGNQFFCNETTIKIKYFQPDPSQPNGRKYYHGWLKPSYDGDNRILVDPQVTDHCKPVRR